MSLKSKFIRAFKKAHKFLIVTVVIFVIISSTCLTSFAEEKYSSTDFYYFSGTKIFLNYGTVDYSSENVIFPSPYGGNFSAAPYLRRPNNSNPIPDVARVYGEFWDPNLNSGRNTLFEFKSGTEYNVSCYFVLPWNNALFSGDDFNITRLDVVLNDDNVDFLAFDCNSASNSSSWSKRSIKINGSDMYFGFYYMELSFVPSRNIEFDSLYFSYYFNLADLPSDPTYFGVSDFVISYNSDSLTEPNYSKPDGSSIQDHNNLANNIENETQAGLDQAVDVIKFDTNNNYFVSMIDGVLLFKAIIDLAFTKLPFYNVLLEFSLALGLFAFLLGLSIYAVGKIGKSGGSGKGNRKGGGG